MFYLLTKNQRGNEKVELAKVETNFLRARADQENHVSDEAVEQTVATEYILLSIYLTLQHNQPWKPNKPYRRCVI